METVQRAGRLAGRGAADRHQGVLDPLDRALKIGGRKLKHLGSKIPAL